MAAPGKAPCPCCSGLDRDRCPVSRRIPQPPIEATRPAQNKCQPECDKTGSDCLKVGSSASLKKGKEQPGS